MEPEYPFEWGGVFDLPQEEAWGGGVIDLVPGPDPAMAVAIVPLEPLAEHAYKPDHEHDEQVTSVGIEAASIWPMPLAGRPAGSVVMSRGA